MMGRNSGSQEKKEKTLDEVTCHIDEKRRFLDRRFHCHQRMSPKDAPRCRYIGWRGVGSMWKIFILSVECRWEASIWHSMPSRSYDLLDLGLNRHSDDMIVREKGLLLYE